MHIHYARVAIELRYAFHFCIRMCSLLLILVVCDISVLDSNVFFTTNLLPLRLLLQRLPVGVRIFSPPAFALFVIVCVSVCE